MKQRRKLKRWQKGLLIALIALVACVVLFPFAIFGLYVLAELEVHPFGCHHRVNPVVSAELVSQEPIVFFELVESPKIDGIKVRLTYEDGSSEIVDAYQSQSHGRFFRGTHEKGMFFHDIGGIDRMPQLEPGVNHIPLYCLDTAYFEDGDPHYDIHGDSQAIRARLAHCMVEVCVQTGDEYIAEHSPPNITVTPSEAGTLAMQGRDRGIIRLLAQESGTYLLRLESEHRTFTVDYSGGGALFSGRSLLPGIRIPDFANRPTDADELEAWLGENDIGSMLKNIDFSSYAPDNSVQYARLNANEPMFLRFVWWQDWSISASIVKRLPEAEISLGETITITEPTVLYIKDFDSAKAQAMAYEALDGRRTFPEGYYVLAGEGYEHYNLNDPNTAPGSPHAVWQGHVIVPKGESAAVTLQMSK